MTLTTRRYPPPPRQGRPKIPVWLAFVIPLLLAGGLATFVLISARRQQAPPVTKPDRHEGTQAGKELTTQEVRKALLGGTKADARSLLGAPHRIETGASGYDALTGPYDRSSTAFWYYERKGGDLVLTFDKDSCTQVVGP